LINNIIYAIKYFIHSDILLYNIITAVVIFIFFLLLKKAFIKYIFNIFHKLSKKTKTKLDDEILNCFYNPLKSFFVILGIYLSLNYLPLPIEFNIYLNIFFRVSIILLTMWGLINFTEKSPYLIKDLENHIDLNFDKILAPFISRTMKLVIVSLAIILIISEFGYNITGFITGLGLGGLAFALAARDTAANLFGGLVIIFDKPFSIGDWIFTPSVEGTVEDISFRSTRVRTFANSVVVVPNSVLTNEPITNWSRMGKRRVTFNIGLVYSTPKEILQNIIRRINNMLIKHPEIHNDTIFVKFDNYGDSSLNIFLYFFTNTTNWGEFLAVKEDVNFKIMDIIKEEGGSFAFPSQSLYIETLPDKNNPNK
jgi:MscS family membrane protein